jgi:redox-sensitive bicupin YhaK (pirin superfamily)
MSIEIYPVSKQGVGEFDGGKIRENKPVPFIGEGNGLNPYSNLFYWAHAWSDKGGLIGIHPHKVFEIMTFVLKGTLEHYDTKNQKWIALKTGNVQIIRAGNGISHSEKMNTGSEMFQIWFDPDIQKTINLPASYNDYPADSFPVTEENGMKVKTYKGENAPITMETPGVTIKEYSFDAVPGEYEILFEEDKVYSLYLMEGSIDTGAGKMNKDDFLVVKGEWEFRFTSSGPGKLFMIETPAEVPYKTYSAMHSM